jgi:DNA-binding transcriptional MerR regulator
MPSSENQPLSKLYYSIGEVAEMLQVNASLLRFWEKEFNLVVSKKNKKGNRLFSVKEIEQIKRIYHFVKIEGYTLDGAKKALKQKTSAHVLETQNTATPTQTNKKDFSDVIEQLEKIKAKLLNLPSINAPAQAYNDILEITEAPIVAPAITTPKKRSAEKPKPASDMPTLFDF